MEEVEASILNEVEQFIRDQRRIILNLKEKLLQIREYLEVLPDSHEMRREIPHFVVTFLRLTHHSINAQCDVFDFDNHQELA